MDEGGQIHTHGVCVCVGGGVGAHTRVMWTGRVPPTRFASMCFALPKKHRGGSRGLLTWACRLGVPPPPSSVPLSRRVPPLSAAAPARPRLHRLPSEMLGMCLELHGMYGTVFPPARPPARTVFSGYLFPSNLHTLYIKP
jgi:hypothetical protein